MVRAMAEQQILVGDTGGTNVRLAIARVSGGAVSLSEIWKRRGADFKTFDAAIDAFLKDQRPQLSGAAFGFAGPVRDGRIQLLHRDWLVEKEKLKAKLGVPRVVMVNDFVAMARSAPELRGDDLREISKGEADAQGSLAIGGPGTGFGIGILRRLIDDRPPITDGWVVVGGEGGHQAFSPQTDIEWKLAEELRQSVGYVSNELVASGSGFDESWEAICHVMGAAPRRLSQQEVIDRAKQGEGVALEFCRIRARCVMTAMGNLALVSNATGGVFIAGGVSVHLEPWLKELSALDRFRKRGPRTDLMAPIPIRLIVSQAAPLVGTAKLWLDEQARGWL
jgi:glucokinase